MISNPRIEAATYESDIHCPSCAEARFGQALYSRDGVTDGQGEGVTLLYGSGWEASPRGECCGACHAEISKPYCPGGYEIFELEAEDFAQAEDGSWMADATRELAPDSFSNLTDCSSLAGWYWQSCQPGCLPDGDAIGPFATEEEALADLLEDF